MNKTITLDSIVMPTNPQIIELQDAYRLLRFNCPTSIFRDLNIKVLQNFCEQILVVSSEIPSKHEICAGFRAYQIYLEIDVKKVDVIDISHLNSEDRVLLCYFATLLPILLYSSPSTHAQNEIKKCLKALKKNIPQMQTAITYFCMIASKFQNRKRNILGKTAIDKLLKELSQDKQANNE